MINFYDLLVLNLKQLEAGIFSKCNFPLISAEIPDFRLYDLHNTEDE